jgi:hypothetical protein
VPRWMRIVLLVILIAVTVVVLFTTVFPWVERQLEDPTMGVGQLEVGHAADDQVVRSPR